MEEYQLACTDGETHIDGAHFVTGLDTDCVNLFEFIETEIAKCDIILQIKSYMEYMPAISAEIWPNKTRERMYNNRWKRSAIEKTKLEAIKHDKYAITREILYRLQDKIDSNIKFKNKLTNNMFLSYQKTLILSILILSTFASNKSLCIPTKCPVTKCCDFQKACPTNENNCLYKDASEFPCSGE